ncbi:MAG: serpin family protein [Lachnospiraceae bacterium]|nr:serpin family protein [Lachnospiraceae bacterium]
MKKRTLAILTGLVTLLGACGAEDPEVPVSDPEVVEEKPQEVNIEYKASENSKNLTEGAKTLEAPEKEFSEEQISALSGASMKLFAEAVKEEGAHPNILLSPTSISLAFGMTENGAKGETLSQIENVISGGRGIEEMNPLLYDLSARLNASKDVRWNVANSIWFKDDGQLKIKEDFAAKAASWYGADIWNAPFDNTTLKDINGWVNAQTHGMIPSILDEIPGDARMFLINALAFEGEWQVKYEDNDIWENRSFINADGSITTVTMLDSTENRYFRIGDGIGFLKDYKGGEYSFMGLLPEEGKDLDAFIAELAAGDEDLAEAIRNCTYDEVIVQIPEFNSDYKLTMNNLLQELGMTTAFSEEAADFSEMMESTDGVDYDIFIGNVLHKTHIEVDRKGTRASAVTSIEMDALGALPPEYRPVSVILDRPFVYGIIDNQTGLPVFLGCTNSL